MRERERVVLCYDRRTNNVKFILLVTRETVHVNDTETDIVDDCKCDALKRYTQIGEITVLVRFNWYFNYLGKIDCHLSRMHICEKMLSIPIHTYLWTDIQIYTHDKRAWTKREKSLNA